MNRRAKSPNVSHEPASEAQTLLLTVGATFHCVNAQVASELATYLAPLRLVSFKSAYVQPSLPDMESLSRPRLMVAHFQSPYSDVISATATMQETLRKLRSYCSQSGHSARLLHLHLTLSAQSA